jgi:hypothetical protein
VNPLHTIKLPDDHRNKWMSAYLLPFPTHAKSEHHAAFKLLLFRHSKGQKVQNLRKMTKK